MGGRLRKGGNMKTSELMLTQFIMLVIVLGVGGSILAFLVWLAFKLMAMFC